MVTTVTEDQVTFRPRRVVWMCTPLAAVLLTVFVTVAVLLRDSDTGVIFRASDQIAMIGIGILLSGATMLFTRPRVRADSEGVEVRNVFTTRRFSWAEVLSVSFPDGASFARLELPEDEYYSVVAVQAVDRERAVLAVRTLRRLHKQARGE
ncbi:PH domain-containing protein [Amycolatopsis aidingensis]|uniref:PH domain-containing protein n=1 Tax=Amycolatopsis aidingensis TaxID=2842453 RepID=UPI001C0AC233|nr:PH domain-containing protein [Amycolatopsis aidingensis]